MFPSIDGSEDLQPVYISPVDNTMSQLIKVFYNYNLKDMYSGQISLMSELKIPDTFIDKSTPAELSVYYSIIEQHAKEREAEMEQDDTVSVLQSRNEIRMFVFDRFLSLTTANEGVDHAPLQGPRAE